MIRLESGERQPVKEISVEDLHDEDRCANSPLAPEGDLDPVALLIRLLLNVRAEGNGTHDTVTKLLVQHSLVGIAVVLDDLVEAVDQGLLRGHLHLVASVRVARHLGSLQCRFVDFEAFGEVLDVFWRGLSLSVEQGSNCYLIAAQCFGDSLE